jgi:hypothetical protein
MAVPEVIRFPFSVQPDRGSRFRPTLTTTPLCDLALHHSCLTSFSLALTAMPFRSQLEDCI